MDKLHLKILKTSDKEFKKKLNYLLRLSKTNQSNLYKTVFDIIEEVKKKGDLALKEFVQNFDKIKLNKIEELFLSTSILKDAYLNLKKEEKLALDLAANRIREFHQYQKPIFQKMQSQRCFQNPMYSLCQCSSPQTWLLFL